jgi:hypothetical protein
MMRVNIGPYVNWIGPHQIADAIFFWVDRRGLFSDEPAIYNRWDYRACDKFGDWLSQTWVNKFCTWLDKFKTRKIKIHIDKYDTWSMDHTLALIIHPMLVQLKATNHGYFISDPEDAPDIDKGEEIDHGHNDSKSKDRYNWIMDEMIWAFEKKAEDYDGLDFPEELPIRDTPEYTPEQQAIYEEWKVAAEAHNNRMRNAFRLFGKYYQNLWD